MDSVLTESWLFENKEWLFSGVGIFVIGSIYKFFVAPRNSDARFRKNNESKIRNSGNIENHTTVNLHQNNRSDDFTGDTSKSEEKKDIGYYKDRTRILFIDDDNKFSVKSILKSSGWIHTSLLSDVSDLDQKEVLEANILFVDIQGVGVKLAFKDGGLGLALAIKERHPEKIVIIYSAETRGNRFHEALRKADSFLPKNAEPYEFQRLVEEYTIGD